MSEHSKRGFAAMDREKQRTIASKGGRASHEKGTAHEFTADEAREAGRKGGEVVSENRQHMSEIGRKGGEASGTRRSRNPQERVAPGEPMAQPSPGPQSSRPGETAQAPDVMQRNETPKGESTPAVPSASTENPPVSEDQKSSSGV